MKTRAAGVLMTFWILLGLGLGAGYAKGEPAGDASGILDLAVTASHSNEVNVLLGDGDGGFASWGDLSGVNEPHGIIAGDFDEDGWPDLAVTDRGDTTICILLNDAGAGFKPPQYFAAGPAPARLRAADLNHDGHLDLVPILHSHLRISVLFGNGDGSFDPPVKYVIGNHPTLVAVGDFNEDGDPDLAVSVEYEDCVKVLAGDSTGAFSICGTFATGDGPVDVDAAYVDQDGHLDLVVTSRYDNRVGVFLGNGDLTFAAGVSLVVGGYPQHTVVEDLDGDGDVDLAISRHFGDSVCVCRGDGMGGFGGCQNWPVGTDPAAVIAAHFNQDEYLDLAVASRADDIVTVLLNNGAAEFADRHDYGVGDYPGELAAANLDGDTYAGTIRGAVAEDSSPVGGAIVDLLCHVDDDGAILVDSQTTDLSDGSYEFEVPPDDYTVELVLPLGYVALSPLSVDVSVGLGDTLTVDFALEAFDITANARGGGYWKHQYHVYDSGKGQAQESLDDLLAYQALIFSRFYERPDEYAIRIEGVTYSAGPVALTFDDALACLSAHGNIGAHARACSQYLAVLLNVVSSKVGLQHVASEDEVTVSQVITYVGDLLEDADQSNDGLANTLAAYVNGNQVIPAGLVPTETPNIAYGGPSEPSDVSLARAWPNPAKGVAWIQYSVPRSGEHVELSVWNLAGRRVRTLVSGYEGGGSHRVSWQGLDDEGRQVAAGVYFCSLRVGESSWTGRIVMLR